MSGRAVVVALLVAVLALTSITAGAVAVRRGRQLDEARTKVARLEEALERRVESGTTEPTDDTDGPSALEDLLGGPLEDLLPDGFGSEGLGGLLDGGAGGGTAGGECISSAVGRLEVDDSGGEQQFDDVLAAVEQLRELEAEREVEPTYLSLDELSARVTELVSEELAEAPLELEQRRLVAFGALAPDVDLRELLVDLYAAQVAGFYDSETEEMVVGTSDPSRPLSALDQMVLAHELTHAVTDQVHDLDAVLEQSPSGGELPEDRIYDGDRDLAALALVEGDATVVGNQYLTSTIGPAEVLGLLTDPRASGGQLPPGLPFVLERELEFPYLTGADYACDLLQAGGWEAVDAAYAQPPTTTAEVLFGERRGAATPSEPEPLAAPGADYEVLGDDVLGAARLSWLFAAPGDDETAALDEPIERVRGWNGDAVRVWTDGPDTAVALVVADRGGGPALCTSIGAWYDAAIPGDAAGPAQESGTDQQSGRTWEGGQQAAALRCTDGRVALAIAPTLTQAERMHR